MKTVFTNGVFHTMEREGDVCGTIVVEDGVIVALDAPAGGRAPLDVDADGLAGARVVDMGGRHVFPALIDSHLHLMDAVALRAMGTPMCALVDGRIEPHDLAGVRARVRDYAAGVPRGSLLAFTDYMPSVVDEGRFPTRRELDEWSDGGLVWLMNMDGHSSSCSTALLEEAGLLGRVADDGVLRGADHDANLGRLTECLSGHLTPGALARGIAGFCNECASLGIGTVCALEGSDDVERDRIGELTALLAQRLPIDVRLYPQYMDERKVAAVARRMAVPRVGGCVKWELDGSVGSRTAAFDAPYDDGTVAGTYFGDEELERTVRSFAQRGFQVTAHAIGEKAIDQLLGVYGRMAQEEARSAGMDAGGDAGAASGAGCDAGAASPGAFPSAFVDDGFGHHLRHRIDHCEFPSAAAVAKLGELRPFVTVQPGYAWFDKRYLHSYERHLAPEKRAQEIPLRTLARAGVPLLGSSDAPVQSIDPFAQMRGMCEAYDEAESLSPFEALRTYTANGGAALGERKGLLREGFEASFFAIERDLCALRAHEFEGLHAEALYLRGRRYRPLPEDLRAFARLVATRPRAI